MSHYRSGSDFEREVRAHLIDEGYWVMKSAGSKTKVDLIAIKTGQILLIQCKRNSICGPAERVEVLRIAAMIDAIPLVAGRPGITLRKLTGPGPKEWVAWATDYAEKAHSGSSI